MGIASLTLGITGLFAWLVPMIGVPICIAGITIGIISLIKSNQYRKRAAFGLGFSFIGLTVSVIWTFVGSIALLEFMYESFGSFGGY